MSSRPCCSKRSCMRSTMPANHPNVGSTGKSSLAPRPQMSRSHQDRGPQPMASATFAGCHELCPGRSTCGWGVVRSRAPAGKPPCPEQRRFRWRRSLPSWSGCACECVRTTPRQSSPLGCRPLCPIGAEVPDQSHRGVRDAQSGALVGRLRLPDDAHGEIRIVVLDSGGIAGTPAKVSDTNTTRDIKYFQISLIKQQ